MLSISLVLALVLDRILPSLQHYRKDLSASRYFRWVEKTFLIKGLPPRLIPLVLLLPALLLVALSGVFFKGSLMALVFFTFIGLAVQSLGFTVIFSFSSDPAWITAVGLSSEAASADTESQVTPPATNLD